MLCGLLASQAAAAVVTPLPRAAEVCDDTETTSLLCYEEPNGTPQNVTVADITYVAGYLRYYGSSTPNPPHFFTMTAADAPDCDEWTLYTHGTVLALGKHLNSALNSSVLFADIATTIDGGPGASTAAQQAAIIGCLTAGGSLGVLVNSTNPAYNTSTYTSSDYTPDGILIKIVQAPTS